MEVWIVEELPHISYLLDKSSADRHVDTANDRRRLGAVDVNVGFYVRFQTEAVNAVDGLKIVGRDVASVSINGIVTDGMQANALASGCRVCHKHEATGVLVEPPNATLSAFGVTRKAGRYPAVDVYGI